MAEYKIYFRTSVEKDFSTGTEERSAEDSPSNRGTCYRSETPGCCKTDRPRKIPYPPGSVQDCIFHSGQATYGVDSEGRAQKRHLSVKGTRRSS